MKATKGKTMFWMADKAFALHTLITLGGLIWSLLIKSTGVSFLLAALWILAFAVWLDFHNS